MQTISTMKSLILISFLCFFLSPNPVWSFFDRDVHLLTMQDGLADNTVLSIYKDEDGFMWFGTNNGLSRYDGKTIKNFGASQFYYMNISEVVEISGTHLAVVAHNELFCFDRTTEKFIPLKFSQGGNAHISHVLPIDNNSFWALSGDALQLYHHEVIHEQDSTFVCLHLEKSYNHLIASDESLMAMAYLEDKQRLCLMSDAGNLLLISTDFPNLVSTIPMINEKVSVTSILYDKGIVWVSTLLHGILRYHTSTGKMDQLTYNGEGECGGLSHTDVFKIVPVNNDRYLAVTWNGYTLLTVKPDHPDEVVTEVFNNTASQLNHNLEDRMLSAYYDENGMLWIGTNGGGVMYSDLQLQFYKQYHQQRHNEICGILMDNDEKIWLATYHQGIMRSDASFDPSFKLSFSIVGSEEVRQRKTVLCALKDEEGNLWFGNMDGTLSSYNENTKQFRLHYLHVAGKVNSLPIWSLYIDVRKHFWIGTEDGLFLFDIELKQGSKVELKGVNDHTPFRVRAIDGTKDGIIGIGTSQAGFYKIMIDDKNHIEYKNGYEKKVNVGSRSVRSLFIASDDNFYVGYTDGYLIFSPKTDEIVGYYTTYNGLCSNFIGCITEDYQGRIWLGNNSGVSRYSRHQHLFYNYYISGNNRSVLMYKNMLFWGNNKNLIYFNVDELRTDMIDDKVLITGLEIDGRLVDIGKHINGQVILTENISYTDAIVLNNENRNVSLAFNNLTYAAPLQKYNYRLFPYQKEWMISTDGGKAVYTNLPAGKYLFEVRSIYPDGNVGEATVLRVTILPHWSQTLWFRLLILFLLGAIFCFFYRRMKVRQKRLEHELRIEHELFVLCTERDKEKQIRMERENFFTSAAHELRTPLTLILSPLQSLISSVSPSNPIYASLAIMYRNGEALHTLVDHLLYVQKIEAGMVKLHLTEIDVVGIVKEQAEAFLQTANARQLDFEILVPDEAVILWIDVSKVAAAIRNLLSNAFKYTPSAGKVTIEVQKIMMDERGYCQIVVADTGMGIPENLQQSVFESFVTGENRPGFSTKVGVGLRIVKHTMDLHHGVILLKSAPNEGSRFTLLIPEGKAHFVDDEYTMIDNPVVENKSFILPASENISADNALMGKKKLLIIEDNDDVRHYICGLFSKDYIVIEAADGEEGIRIAMEQVPDLIISDVMMPVKDGFTCCRELREQLRTAHIPILILTAKAEDTDVLSGVKVGADDYMIKPFNPEVLKSKVGNLIRQRERLKRIYTKTLMLKSQKDTDADNETTDDFMRQIIQVVEANLANESFNVKILADQLNMSQPTLYRKIKQRSELNAIEIIRSVKMSKAASLIMENKYSMQEIAEMVGYSDTRTLRKHFSEQFGVSPSKYMEKE